MLNVLQKEYTLDVIEFARWQDEVFHRRTLLGVLSYYIGKIVAVTFIVKLCLSIKNVVQPDYKSEMIGKTTRLAVSVVQGLLGMEQTSNGVSEMTSGDFIGPQEGPLAITIFIEYCILAMMALLIASNVQSFLRKLLVTLKNILRDNDIAISYHTTMLVFSFIMGTYYFSILLQMSNELPAHKKEPFAYLLNKFTPQLVMYTFDCFFVISSLLAGFLIWFNWLVKRVPT